MSKDPQVSPDELMTVGPAARCAAVTAATLKTWIDDGKLPAQRTTTGIRLVRRADLLAFIERREQLRRSKATAA